MTYVYVKNKDDALDVVQEVACQSFKKIDTFMVILRLDERIL